MPDVEEGDWKLTADDGVVGGNAEAMAQKGHDGSAVGGHGEADMVLGQIRYVSSRQKINHENDELG